MTVSYTHLSKASDVVLNSMNMSQLNETSEMLKSLAKIMDQFDINEIKDNPGPVSYTHLFGIDDINLIKPGIGETTRVLLRRIPWKVLIDERYKGNPQLEHIVLSLIHI